MKKILSFGLMLILGTVAAQGAEVTFSPAPPVAGEPVTITYHGVTAGCDPVGVLTVHSIVGQVIHLRVEAPGCAILPSGPIEYTASTTVGPLPVGTYAVYVIEVVEQRGVLHAYEEMQVSSVPVCEATETSLCLGGSRFAVTGEWTDFEGNEGVAHAVPDDFDGLGDYGTFWFFSPENPEMVVKVIDACSFNGYYWVFLSPASTVKYDIIVRDARNNIQKTYSNAAGNVPALTADTSAFPCPLGAP